MDDAIHGVSHFISYTVARLITHGGGDYGDCLLSPVSYCSGPIVRDVALAFLSSVRTSRYPYFSAITKSVTHSGPT